MQSHVNSRCSNTGIFRAEPMSSASPPRSVAGSDRASVRPQVRIGKVGSKSSQTEAFGLFRRLICTDCESYGESNCICPLVTLCLTASGRQVLERERCYRSIRAEVAANDL